MEIVKLFFKISQIRQNIMDGGVSAVWQKVAEGWNGEIESLKNL